ncbi:bet_lambda, phage recombination protein Bet [uncultured Caudovirales phage]|uniref:Bet_lambda, phage recombination protein Bet n=1 Tax=uncultured Caudovirales phage TaxID=2100421 RepID=A0A6J5KM74_9CAUD|nr:bet_lambda, phage recombination protein Bet [uncultured Caudovirales phage]
MTLPTTTAKASLLQTIAAKYGVDPEKMLTTLKATAFKSDKEPVTNEQMMALLVVANQYDLNPWTKEIYAFPDKKNGIIPVVGIDGWSRIINSNPLFDGMDFIDAHEMIESATNEHKPCPAWIECRIYRKDRSRFISVRERFAECYRPPFKGQYGPVVGPWQTHTSRFLRHKAMIQAARIAFGFAGIFDPDEAERIREATNITSVVTVTDATPRKRTAMAALEQFSGGGSQPDPVELTAEGVTSDGEFIEELDGNPDVQR